MGYYKVSTRTLYEADWRRRERAAEEVGECFAAGKKGRYEEKGGGTYVGSFFKESENNEKIKAVYGNYGFWAWVRYWYIDTENIIRLLLADKGYHDYDYEEPIRKHNRTSADREIWSDDKVASVLSRLIDPASGKRVLGEREHAEWLQREVMKDKGINPEVRPR